MAQVHYDFRNPNSFAQPRRWSLTAPLELREWEGEFVVWAAGTGTTYLLSTLAGNTIKYLRDGPAAAADIVERMNKRQESTSRATAGLIAKFARSGGQTHVLLVVLDELEALGLVEVQLT